MYEAELETSSKLRELVGEYDKAMNSMVLEDPEPLKQEITRLQGENSGLVSQLNDRDKQLESQREQLTQLEASSAAAKAERDRALKELESIKAQHQTAVSSLQNQLDLTKAALDNLQRAKEVAEQEHAAAIQQSQQIIESLKRAAAQPAPSPPTPSTPAVDAKQLRLWQLKCSRLTTELNALIQAKQALEASNRDLVLICDELLVLSSTP